MNENFCFVKDDVLTAWYSASCLPKLELCMCDYPFVITGLYYMGREFYIVGHQSLEHSLSLYPLNSVMLSVLPMTS